MKIDPDVKDYLYVAGCVGVIWCAALTIMLRGGYAVPLVFGLK